MIWRDGVAHLSDQMWAAVFHGNEKWLAMIEANGGTVTRLGRFDNEQAAKDAVCHWIGKTMAQLSNALAAGYEQPDDGA